MKYTAYSGKTVYPQDIQCVLQPKQGKGGIYIGNLEASENLATLKKYNIKAILTAARDIKLNHPKSQIPYHLHIPGEDHENFDLTRYFQKSIQFIHKSLNQTNILVHCMAGISRSVSLVLAYLMKHHDMSYQQAFEAVRRKRRIINPNRGFIKQLKQYQKTLEMQKQAMRRSVDNFPNRGRAALYQSKRTLQYSPSRARQYLNQSIRRTNINNISNTQNRYSTIPYHNEQNFQEALSPNKYAFNTKYQIPSKGNKNTAHGSGYASYNDLNRQLDQKIANIRKKYMEATDLLNRQDRKHNTKVTTKSYFKDVSITDGSCPQDDKTYSRFDYPMFRKTATAYEHPRNARTNSTANYVNKSQNYMYYNY